MTILGVDLGTTNSLAVVYKDGLNCKTKSH